ncbi:hypothetical protein GR254_22140 [Mycobacterium tuberculosis]|nr:hypothetical protein [Mycobacterium tuberculosis]
MCCAVCGPEPGRIGEVTPLGPCPAQHRGGPLRPSELAQASVMAALCAVTTIMFLVLLAVTYYQVRVMDRGQRQ